MLSAPTAFHVVDINPGDTWRDQIATDETTGDCWLVWKESEFSLVFQSHGGDVIANWTKRALAPWRAAIDRAQGSMRLNFLANPLEVNVDSVSILRDALR
jgi:hypothetical protein